MFVNDAMTHPRANIYHVFICPEHYTNILTGFTIRNPASCLTFIQLLRLFFMCLFLRLAEKIMYACFQIEIFIKCFCSVSSVSSPFGPISGKFPFSSQLSFHLGLFNLERMRMFAFKSIHIRIELFETQYVDLSFTTIRAKERRKGRKFVVSPLHARDRWCNMGGG